MLQRFLDPAVLAGISGLDLVAQDGGRRLHRRPAPLARFRFQPGVRRVSRLHSRRRSAPRGLERVRAHGERMFLKRYRGETNCQVTILLDASRSMKFTLAQDREAGVCASFWRPRCAYLAHPQRDAAGLIVFDDEVRNFVPPSTRQGQLRAAAARESKSATVGNADRFRASVRTLAGIPAAARRGGGDFGFLGAAGKDHQDGRAAALSAAMKWCCFTCWTRRRFVRSCGIRC